MPTNTQPNNALVLKFGSNSYECQVINLTFTPPGVSASTVTEVCCPGGRVAEPGTISSGSITGEVFSDSLDTGITWVLAQARAADTTLTYELTLWSDLGVTKAMKYTGDCRVNSFSQSFSKPGVGRTPLDLEVVTSTLARPAAAA